MNEAMMKIFMKALGMDAEKVPAMIQAFGEGMQKFSSAIERIEAKQQFIIDSLILLEAKVDTLEMNMQARLPLNPDVESVFPGAEAAVMLPRVVMSSEAIEATRQPQRQLTPEELQGRAA